MRSGSKPRKHSGSWKIFDPRSASSILSIIRSFARVFKKRSIEARPTTACDGPFRFLPIRSRLYGLKLFALL